MIHRDSEWVRFESPIPIYEVAKKKGYRVQSALTLSGQAIEAPLKPKNFDSRLAGVESGLLECHSNPESDLAGIISDVIPGNDRLASGRSHERTQHVNRG